MAAAARPMAIRAARPGLREVDVALAGLEAGGTKFVCVVGDPAVGIAASHRVEVGEPGPTIAAALAWFRERRERGTPIEALGIGTFGPVELRTGHPLHGWITTTPKPGWSMTDLAGPFAQGLGVPVAVDTDVNAAALAEWRHGAARGLRSFVYLIVGTGIGGGAIVEGRLLHGLGHPEMGHVAVARRPGDAFPGSCPFHGDCLEGMASGPAVAARFGRRAEELTGMERDEAVAVVAWYLAAGIAGLAYALAPERFVLGGGITALPGLVPAVRDGLAERLAGYPALPDHANPAFLVAPALGLEAGAVGALELAAAAFPGR